MTGLSPAMVSALRELGADHLVGRKSRVPHGNWGRTLLALESRRLVVVCDNGRYKLSKWGALHVMDAIRLELTPWE